MANGTIRPGAVVYDDQTKQVMAFYVDGAETPINASALSSSPLVLNIASRGEVSTAAQTVSAPAIRHKGRRAYRIRTAASRIRFIYANRRIDTAGETNGAGAISFVKAAAENTAGAKPVLFSGLRTATMAAGAVDFASDWINMQVLPGDTVYHRCTIDAASGWVTDNFTNGDQSWVYNPVNEVDDVDSTGSMTQPSGATNTFPFHPVMIVGEVRSGEVAVIGVMDSIGWGLADLGSSSSANQLGNGGGGFARRAMWRLGVPYTSFAQSGRTLAASVSSSTLLASLVKYHTHGIQQLGTNDLGSTSVATMKTNYSSVWNTLRNNLVGVKHVQQLTLLPKVTSTNGCTSLVGQTPVSGFASNDKRDQVNSWFRERLSVELDSVCDISKAVEAPSDSSRWNVFTWTTTLAALAASNASSIQVNAVPVVGESLQFDPGGANNSNGFACVSNVTGTAAPFTATLQFSPGIAQSNGATVTATFSNDGIHPGGSANVLMELKLAADFPRR